MVKGNKVCSPGKLDWVLVVALAGCQPWKMHSQSWVAADDVMAGFWCVVGTGQCSGQEWKDAGHAVRGVGRELVWDSSESNQPTVVPFSRYCNLRPFT